MISPEAASILWRDTKGTRSRHQHEDHGAGHGALFGVDTVVMEPTGGHRGPQVAIAAIGEAIGNALEELRPLDRETVRRQRREAAMAEHGEVMGSGRTGRRR